MTSYFAGRASDNGYRWRVSCAVVSPVRCSQVHSSRRTRHSTNLESGGKCREFGCWLGKAGHWPMWLRERTRPTWKWLRLKYICIRRKELLWPELTVTLSSVTSKTVGEYFLTPSWKCCWISYLKLSVSGDGADTKRWTLQHSTWFTRWRCVPFHLKSLWQTCSCFRLMKMFTRLRVIQYSCRDWVKV